MPDASTNFSGKEKRQNERIKSNEPVSIKYEDSEYNGVIKDKGEKSFYIEIIENLPIGLKVNLEYYSETAKKILNFTTRIVRKDFLRTIFLFPMLNL